MRRTTTEITHHEDIIDSRDVIARIAYLRGERDGYETEAAWEAAEYDAAMELLALVALQDQAEGYSDWPHGATLINDAYFEEYAQDLAEDLCMVSREVAWPYTCIDWAQAARELQQDYTSVEFSGVTYWVRS